MSNDLTAIKAQNYKAAETRRHNNDLKNLNQKFKSEFDKNSNLKKSEIERIKKQTENILSSMDLTNKGKITELRRKHEKILKEEEQRLELEMNNLLSTHSDQMSEIKKSQKVQLENLLKEHNDTLTNAREKFKQEQIKYITT